MLINRRSEYAILGLLSLARMTAVSSSLPFLDIREVALDAVVPEQFLRVLFHKLAKSGILASRRGAKGGFALGKPADEITLLDIIETIQGPLAPFDCVRSDDLTSECDRSDRCELYGVLRRVRGRITAELELTTLAGLMENRTTVTPKTIPITVGLRS